MVTLLPLTEAECAVFNNVMHRVVQDTAEANAGGIAGVAPGVATATWTYRLSC